MPEALEASVGIGVVHLFCTVGEGTDRAAIDVAVKAAQADDLQVVSVAVLGHKADVAFMVLGKDWWKLKSFQTAIQVAGLTVVDSYVSMTELSEYAKGLPEQMAQARLYPQLPPEGMTAWCFYPMSKKRERKANWFSLPFEERKELMMEHGASGRKFAGRIVQLITGSAGVDDYEWGVTLFAQKPDDLKEVVYTMRFDEASAKYADFGPFFAGAVGTLTEVLDAAGVPADRPVTALGDSPAATVEVPGDLGIAYERLRAVMADLGSAMVAFSGGADSALVAWVAHDVLGSGRATAVTASSASLADEEHLDCQALAAEWGLTWQIVSTDELADDRYVANDGDRCYWCKTALLDALVPLAAAADATVVLGVNVDDLGDHRPGQRAAAERGARFPLVEAGFTKPMVRDLSRHLGLRTADKPAAACLASRIPYGTPVTVGILAEVEAAESALKAIGFPELRVRHYRDLARLEVPVDRLAEVVERRAEVVGAVRAAGYRYVTLDLEGLRSGNLNGALGGVSTT